MASSLEDLLTLLTPIKLSSEFKTSNVFADELYNHRFQYDRSTKTFTVQLHNCQIDSDELPSDDIFVSAYTISRAITAINTYKQAYEEKYKESVEFISIDLQNNIIGNQGVKVLADYLKQLDIPSILNVSNNYLGYKALKELVSIPKLIKVIVADNTAKEHLANRYLKLDPTIMNKIQWNNPDEKPNLRTFYL